MPINRNLILLFSINVLVATYWNMTGPLIPLFIRSLNASVFQVSLVLFIGGLASALVVMPSGSLSDRYGERKLIILSNILLCIFPLLYSISDTWEETIPWSILNMTAFSLFIPARMTLIAGSVKPESMATAYGVMNMAWPIGGVIGPFLGGFLADNYGWSPFFYFLFLIAFLCMILSFFLNETDKKGMIVDKKSKVLHMKGSITLLLGIFFFAHIFGNTARGILGTIFPFYLTENFHKTKTEAGLFFSIGFGIATLTTQFPSGILADKFGHKKIMAYGTFMIPVFASFFLFLKDYIPTLLIYMAITGLWSTTWPASIAYLISITPASKRGLMVGIRQMAVRLGFTVGPLIGGFLWDNFDPAVSFYVVIFFFAASFILILLLKDNSF